MQIRNLHNSRNYNFESDSGTSTFETANNRDNFLNRWNRNYFKKLDLSTQVFGDCYVFDSSFYRCFLSSFLLIPELCKRFPLMK